MSITMINDGGLEEDIIEVINAAYMEPDALTYSCIIHTPEIDQPISILENIEILRDYAVNITDQILVTCLYPMGDFVKDILPYSDNLEMTIITKYYDKSISIRYKFIFNNNLGGVSASLYDNMSREALNEAENVNIEGQCLDRVVEAIRITYSDGIYQYTSVDKVIKVLLKEQIDNVKIEGVTPEVTITVVKPNNILDYRHIEIPYGTNVLDVPSYLQNTDYGVYNSGIGTYYQNYDITDITGSDYKKGIFVYPLFDRYRYEEPVKKLMILSNPTNKYKYVENTYMVDGDIIKIIASNNAKNFDDGDNSNIDVGNSIVRKNMTSVMEGNKNVTVDTVTNDIANNIKGYKSYDKRDGINKAVHVEAESNLYKEKTNMVKNTMTLFQIRWDFCNHELLHPGMPVSYIYYSDKLGQITLRGVLQSSFIRYSQFNKTVSCILNILVEKPYYKSFTESSIIDLT